MSIDGKSVDNEWSEVWFSGCDSWKSMNCLSSIFFIEFLNGWGDELVFESDAGYIRQFFCLSLHHRRGNYLGPGTRWWLTGCHCPSNLSLWRQHKFGLITWDMHKSNQWPEGFHYQTNEKIYTRSSDNRYRYEQPPKKNTPTLEAVHIYTYYLNFLYILFRYYHIKKKTK